VKPEIYRKVGRVLIRPLLLSGEQSAFDLARLFYAQYGDMNFEEDLIEYMRNGYVVTRPKLFAMVKVVDYEGERVWYIRIVVGNLLELITTLPFMLPKLLFTRNNQPDQMRIVDTQTLLETAMKRIGEKHAQETVQTNGSR
jgi:hypothetical protein